MSLPRDPLPMDAARHTCDRWRRLAWRGGLLLFGAGLALLPPAAPAQESPKELRARASQALSAGAFEDAIPPLAQLIDWFKNEKDPTIVAELESLYYNLPTILSDIPVFRECFAGMAKLVPPDDIDAIAAAIREVLLQKEKPLTQTQIKQNFSWEKTVGEFMAIVNDLS